MFCCSAIAAHTLQITGHVPLVIFSVPEKAKEPAHGLIRHPADRRHVGSAAGVGGSAYAGSVVLMRRLPPRGQLRHNR